MSEVRTSAPPKSTSIEHRPCGRSGLRLSRLSLGTWYNFGPPEKTNNATHGLTTAAHEDNARALIRTAYEAGVTHFDTADVYGSESLLGSLLADYPREELAIGSKAGYGAPQSRGGGSHSHLIERCERSLRELKLDYLDLFTHHCPDLGTPLEETLRALDQLVRSGKVRYTGISSYGYDPERTEAVARICRERDYIQPVYHQTGYSLLDRIPESKLFEVCETHGIGFCAITALAHGRLTGKYLKGVPEQSRRAKAGLQHDLHPDLLERIRELGVLAEKRGQSIAQCALAFALAENRVTSVLIGASRPEMLQENLAAIHHTAFDADERATLDRLFPPSAMSPHFDDY